MQHVLPICNILHAFHYVYTVCSMFVNICIYIHVYTVCILLHVLLHAFLHALLHQLLYAPFQIINLNICCILYILYICSIRSICMYIDSVVDV